MMTAQEVYVSEVEGPGWRGRQVGRRQDRIKEYKSEREYERRDRKEHARRECLAEVCEGT